MISLTLQGFSECRILIDGQSQLPIFAACSRKKVKCSRFDLVLVLGLLNFFAVLCLLTCYSSFIAPFPLLHSLIYSFSSRLLNELTFQS